MVVVDGELHCLLTETHTGALLAEKRRDCYCKTDNFSTHSNLVFIYDTSGRITTTNIRQSNSNCNWL